MQSIRLIPCSSLAVIILLVWSSPAIAQKICFENCWEKMSDSSSPFAALDILRQLQGCPAPEFTVKTIDGEVISFETGTNPVIVMNFWFIGCKPCIKEMPRLNELVTSFSGKDVLFLSFALDSIEDLKTKFITRWDFKYKIVPGEYRMSKKYCVQPYPTHMVIDKSGKVAFAAFDSVEEDASYQKLKAAIEHALMQ